MDGFKSPDEIIRQAFALAYFILGDEAAALSVVREALSKLEVTAAAQVKRLYYSPTRRPLWHKAKPANSRTKVCLSDTHLLQRLVYVESEPYERERERRPQSLRDEDLLVHFVKHLIRISIRRNSFYVALGVSRLLHSYSTSETMEIYNVVVQDPDRVKDDYYYRSRKGRLLQEVRERFDEFVSVCRGPRGEERFQTMDAPDGFVELVAECLEQFSPWRTPCSIPPRYDPTTDEIPRLSSAHQSEEDRAEINRIHAVVHPGCYELLTNSLKLEPPALRLSVPRFNLPNGKNNMSRPKDKPRRPAPPLDENDVAALRRILGEQSARRRSAHASLLSVVVDRVERARLDLGSAGSVSFEVNDRDELVEVRALEGDGWTLLATHLLGGEPHDGARPSKSEIVLEGGQRLTFTLSPAPGVAGEEARASMSVSYRETQWRSAAALFARRAARRLTAPDASGGRRGAAFVRPAFAALILILCAGALSLYLFRGTRGPDAEQMAANLQQRPPVSRPLSSATTNGAPADSSNSSETAAAPQPSTNGPRASTKDAAERGAAENFSAGGAALKVATKKAARPVRSVTPPLTAQADTRAGTSTRPPATERAQAASGRSNPETEVGAAGSGDSDTTRGDSDATRSVGSNVGATALARVRKVFIEVAGDGGLSEQTARLLAADLRESQRLIPTDVRDEADAALKIKVGERTNQNKASRGPAERQVTVSARLVNEGGEVIWPAGDKARGGVYSGKVEDATRRIAADLLKAVRKSDAQK